MAKLTEWSIFVRAFIISLLAAAPTRVGGASEEEQQAWRSALEANTASGYHGFLSKYPSSEYVRDAIDRLGRLGAIDAPPKTRELGGAGAAGGAAAGSVY